MLPVYGIFPEDTRSDKGFEKGSVTIRWKHFMQLRISPLNIYPCVTYIGLPRWYRGKEPTCQCRRGKRHTFGTWVGKIPWRRAWQPTSVFLPGKFHGQRSLAGYSQSMLSQRVGHSEAAEHAQCIWTIQGSLEPTLKVEGHRMLLGAFNERKKLAPLGGREHMQFSRSFSEAHPGPPVTADLTVCSQCRGRVSKDDDVEVNTTRR